MICPREGVYNSYGGDRYGNLGSYCPSFIKTPFVIDFQVKESQKSVPLWIRFVSRLSPFFLQTSLAYFVNGETPCACVRPLQHKSNECLQTIVVSERHLMSMSSCDVLRYSSYIVLISNYFCSSQQLDAPWSLHYIAISDEHHCVCSFIQNISIM